ncbi:MAG TPA: AI-2E family transporter [Candidatus Paceibacterota bacterium]|nr:AI-2E family transporter [Candidatus Paceibacterota bacterium]
MQKDKLESLSLSGLFIGVSLLLLFIFAPFFSLLSLAVVFAVFLRRPYERLVKALRGWDTLAALLMVALVLALCIVPLFFLGVQIYAEARGLYSGLAGTSSLLITNLQTFVENPLQQVLPGFTFDINAFVGNALVVISDNLGSLVYRTLFILFDTFLMLLALFFFLRDGDSMLASFTDVSPFGRKITVGILNTMHQTIRSVVRGTLVNALIRWVLIWIAFSLFNIPNAVLWSSIGGVVGAIPGLGTIFAFIPAVMYLYLGGNIAAAVGLALAGVLVIVLVDNILTSYFFGKGGPVSPLFVLFSILGGIFFFGPLGFILGPLVLSVFLSVLHVYGLEEHRS